MEAVLPDALGEKARRLVVRSAPGRTNEPEPPVGIGKQLFGRKQVGGLLLIICGCLELTLDAPEYLAARESLIAALV